MIIDEACASSSQIEAPNSPINNPSGSFKSIIIIAETRASSSQIEALNSPVRILCADLKVVL